MPWASVTRNHTPSPPATAEASHTTPQTPPNHPALWVWTPLWRSADLIMLKRLNDLTRNKCRLSWEAPKECGSFSLCQSSCPLTPQSSGVAAVMHRALWAGLTFECLCHHGTSVRLVLMVDQVFSWHFWSSSFHHYKRKNWCVISSYDLFGWWSVEQMGLSTSDRPVSIAMTTSATAIAERAIHDGLT